MSVIIAGLRRVSPQLWAVAIIVTLTGLMLAVALRDASSATGRGRPDSELLRMARREAVGIGVPSDSIHREEITRIPDVVRGAGEVFIYRAYGTFDNLIVWGGDGGPQTYIAVDLRLDAYSGVVMSSAFTPAGK